MSSTMNDTTKTATDGVASVREGTEHTFAGTLATLVKGVTAVSGLVGMLRTLARDDGLAWLGVARRRPLHSAATFGAGVALGAGLGVLFAPTSGAELRRNLFARSSKEPAVSDAATPPHPATYDTMPPPRPAVSDAMPPPRPAVIDAAMPPRPAVVASAPIPAEHDVGFGASHGYDSTHGGPSGPGDVPAKVAKTPPAENHRPTGHRGSA